MVFTILNYVSLAISILGIIVITWGVILVFVKFVGKEFNRGNKQKMCRKNEGLRHSLGSYLLLGLEILIAADIINTITHPTLKEIAILASIVVIRTVISYFLDLEMAGGFGSSSNWPQGNSSNLF